MKPRIIDYMFLLIYVIVLLFLLFSTPVILIGGIGSSPEVSTLLSPEFTGILLYIIAAPFIYFILRRYLYPKNKTNQP